MLPFDGRPKVLRRVPVVASYTKKSVVSCVPANTRPPASAMLPQLMPMSSDHTVEPSTALNAVR